MLFYNSASHFSACKLTAISPLPISHNCKTVELSQPFCLFSSKMRVKLIAKARAQAGGQRNLFRGQQPPRDPRRPWQGIGPGASVGFHNLSGSCTNPCCLLTLNYTFLCYRFDWEGKLDEEGLIPAHFFTNVLELLSYKVDVPAFDFGFTSNCGCRPLPYDKLVDRALGPK